jgi:hypothetical protein
MGGHQSVQSVSISTNVVGSAVQKVTQSCISYVNSDNVLAVSGDGNVLGDVTQTMSVSVNSVCSANITQNAKFQNSLANSVSELLKDQEVSMTQWLDNSQDDSNAAIQQNVTTNVTSTTVQTCLDNINSQNILNITGSGNIIKDAVQSSTVSMISHCLLSQGQTSQSVNAITNTVNQHSTYTSKNPLAFMSDAIESVIKSVIMIAAVIFIVVICFIGIFIVLRKRKRNAAAATPAAPATFE